jgi:hypothetical protein
MISVVRNFNDRQRISFLQSHPRYLLDTAPDAAEHPGHLSPLINGVRPSQKL